MTIVEPLRDIEKFSAYDYILQYFIAYGEFSKMKYSA